MPWLFESCLPKQYCASPVPRPRYTFDVFPQVPLTFLETAPCSRVVGEQFAQMLVEGRSLACASHVDDSGEMPMRLQTMSGWTHSSKGSYLSSRKFSGVALRGLQHDKMISHGTTEAM